MNGIQGVGILSCRLTSISHLADIRSPRSIIDVVTFMGLKITKHARINYNTTVNYRCQANASEQVTYLVTHSSVVRADPVLKVRLPPLD